MNNNHDNFRKSGSSGQKLTVNTTANMKKAGVKKENIWLDPGFGFAKNVEQNLELLKGLDQITSLGYPVLFGISRKRVVDSMLGGNTKPQERDMATAALSAYAVGKGCQIVRVHNVPVNKDIVRVTSQLM